MSELVAQLAVLSHADRGPILRDVVASGEYWQLIQYLLDHYKVVTE